MISNVYSKSYIQASAAASAQARHILFERLLPVLFESAHPSQTPRGIEIHSLFLATTMDFISAYIFGIKNSTDFLRNKGYRDHWLELYLSRHDHPFFPQELPLVTSVLRLSFLQPLLVWLGLDLKLYPSWVDAANRELEAWNMEICGRAIEYLKSTSPMQPQQDAAYEPVVLRALLSGIDKERRSHADQQNKYESPLAATVLCHQDRSVASELFDHVLAGQETAGVALTYITWHLSRRPDLQDELRSELLTLSPSLRFEDNGDGSSRAAAGMGAPDALPNLRHLDALPLLHAIVTETLRLNAPLPGPQPRVTPSPGCVLGGAESKRFWVPGAVRIAALAHALHRDEDVFEAAETWEPRRWLPPRSAGEQDRKGNEAETGDGEAEDRRREMNRRFWAFGSGGRMCIGSHFAMHGTSSFLFVRFSRFPWTAHGSLMRMLADGSHILQR